MNTPKDASGQDGASKPAAVTEKISENNASSTQLKPPMGRHASTGEQQPAFPGSIAPVKSAPSSAVPPPAAAAAPVAAASTPSTNLVNGTAGVAKTPNGTPAPGTVRLNSNPPQVQSAGAAAAAASGTPVPTKSVLPFSPAPQPAGQAGASTMARLAGAVPAPAVATEKNPPAISKPLPAAAPSDTSASASNVASNNDAFVSNGTHSSDVAPPPVASAAPLPPAVASQNGQPQQPLAGAALAQQQQLLQQQQQQQQEAAAAVAKPFGDMRVLRVEDALLYLDEVKRQFSYSPHVYNEFLCIMKNFKSQEVDTPGVIARVSRLFRGHNNLILGFNKFLPDGYKIRMEDLQMQEAARQEAERLLQLQQQQQQQQAHQQPNQQREAASDANHMVVDRQDQQWQQQTATDASKPVMDPSMQQPSPAHTGLPHALRGTPMDVGHASPAAAAVPHMAPPTLSNGPHVALKTQPMPVADNMASMQSMQPQAQKSIHHPQVQQQPTQQQQQQQPPAQPPQQAPAATSPPPQQHQAVEFDHAIAYVTTIKRRFANDPSTYHSFLEILHTYQKEQKGIKEVLEQVAHLFQDHPDLLREFTFFLPDAVQEQAKERLHRAAADSEARQGAQRQLEQQQQHQSMHAHGGEHSDPEADRKVIDMTGQYAESAANDGRVRKRQYEQSAATASIPISIPHQPETYIYNCAVERQFFDAAREALTSYTRDGGQAWAEFVKCLDMYAQEILSRSEMLNFVEPLLGKRNTKLFEEFKRILAATGSTVSTLGGSGSNFRPAVSEDSWHSVPLSEIDFTRCRRCSPSYRALPRDYPAPPCSERTDDDAKVLNDTWVSLPVGSEESYTFRHMRRNTHEETLFSCEDERFEIDMVIDSNVSTLHRLEPIAEEIAQLAEAELLIMGDTNVAEPAASESGMGGRKFQYSFDKSILGVIQRNSVARIYGDHGHEMLDLMVKNPSVAIPLIVERLRQKDREWRKVRSRLNRHWKDLAQANYYRSLDHRSLTWRVTDKRAISTRTFVADIKDRAAHSGKESKKALQDRMDKAKDEHGAFFEVTMASTLSRTLDLTNLPKPDRQLFTPHFSVMYENIDWAQRDAYRILAFAVERSAMSPEGKERCQRLWTSFLAPWFHLSMSWMVRPSIAYMESDGYKNDDMPPIVSNGEESADEDGGGGTAAGDDAVMKDVTPNGETTPASTKTKPETTAQTSPSPPFMGHHPLPTGAPVSTIFGDGHILNFRRTDQMYAVKLPFGTAYLRPTAVLCSVFDTEKSDYTDQLRVVDRTNLARPDDMLFIGTQSLYLFFRLHQILVRRLCIAKRLAFSVKDDEQLTTLVEQMSGEDPAALGRQRYDAFVGLVYALLDGGAAVTGGGAAEGGKYEDRVRSLLGHGGYELATMDKLISHILKNMQAMGNDETMWNLVQLFRRHLSEGSFKPEAFRQEASTISSGEDMYAFQKCAVPEEDGNKSIIHMEYLGVISERGEDGGASSEPVSDRHPPVHKRQKRER